MLPASSLPTVGQTPGPELIESQLLVQFAGQPTGSPLSRPMQFHLSKARDFLPGLISFTSVNVRRENLITARSGPWLSSGYASFSPAGRPTSPTMNPSISTPSQNEILPLLRLDGTPQTLEGTDAQRWEETV